MPTSCRRRSKVSLSAASVRSRIGARARFASSWCAVWTRTCASRPRAPSTPCCTGTAWSRASAGAATDRATGTELSAGVAPNELWCADFKGQFKLGNGHYCYPLTVTDHASRYLLMCEALESTREDTAITAFEQLFLERGPTLRHPLRQRRPLRQPQRALQPFQTFRLVATTGHCN